MNQNINIPNLISILKEILRSSESFTGSRDLRKQSAFTFCNVDESLLQPRLLSTFESIDDSFINKNISNYLQKLSFIKSDDIKLVAEQIKNQIYTPRDASSLYHFNQSKRIFSSFSHFHVSLNNDRERTIKNIVKKIVHKEDLSLSEINELDLFFINSQTIELLKIPIPFLSTPSIILVTKNVFHSDIYIAKFITEIYNNTRSTLNNFIYNLLITNLQNHIDNIYIRSTDNLVEQYIFEICKLILPLEYTIIKNGIRDNANQYVTDQWVIDNDEDCYFFKLNLKAIDDSYEIIFKLTSFHYPTYTTNSDTKISSLQTNWIHRLPDFEIHVEQNKLMMQSIFNLILKQWIEEKEIKTHATKAALSQVMARNASHNIGSHTLSRLISESNVKTVFNSSLKNKYKCNQYIPISSAKYSNTKLISHFNSYLKTRMDFIADFTTSTPSMESTKWFFKDVLSEFDGNYILLDRISGINDFHFQLVPRNLTSMESINCQGLCESCENCDEFDSCLKNKTSGERAECCNNKPCLIKWRENSDGSLAAPNDILVSIPNDVLGYHAIFIILENFIRNIAKHGNKKNVKIYIDILDRDDLYEIILFDNIQYEDKTISLPNKPEYQNLHSRDIHELKRIDKVIFDLNNSIKMPVLDSKTGGLRMGGWGLIEMNAAASYLRKIPPELIDHVDYQITNDPLNTNKPEYSNEKSGKAIVFKAFAKNKKYIGYRFFLLKPKVLFILDEYNELGRILKSEQSHLLFNLGVLIAPFHREYNPEDVYPYNFFIYIGDKFEQRYKENASGLSSRRYHLNADKAYEMILNINGYEALEEMLWNGLFKTQYKNRIYSELNFAEEFGFPLHNDTSRLVYYSDHGSDFQSKLLSKKYAFIEIDRSVTKPFYPNSFIGKLKFSESVFHRVMVLDERIQEHALTATYKPEDADEINIKEIYFATNILVPSKKSCDLNDQNFDEGRWAQIKEYFHTGQNALIDDDKSTGTFNFEFCIIHLGIIEKMIESYNREKNCSEEITTDSSGIFYFIKNILIGDIPNFEEILDRIIIISGRGRPHNLPMNVRYLNYSIISQYLIEIRYKYLLCESLFRARRIT